MVVPNVDDLEDGPCDGTPSPTVAAETPTTPASVCEKAISATETIPANPPQADVEAKSSAQAEHVPPPLPKLTSSGGVPKKSHGLPPRGKQIAVAVVLFVVAAIAMKYASGETNAKREALADERLAEALVINEKEIRNRHESKPLDFSPTGLRVPISFGGTAGLRVAAPALGNDAELSVEERRKKRAADPEDVASVKRSGQVSVASSTAEAATDSPNGFRRSFVYFEAPGAAASQAGRADLHQAGGSVLAVAGSVIPVVLSARVLVRGGGGNTAVAIVEKDAAPVPKGTRFVGTASGDGEGRLSLRFRKVLLPDGREAQTDGEAQDLEGAFSLQGEFLGGQKREEPSIAKDVVKETSVDLAEDALSALTGGIGGRAARTALRRSTRPESWSNSRQLEVSLARGTEFQVFLHEAVALVAK